MVHQPNPHQFGDLPSELLIEIASYCQVFAILRLQRMNRKFHVTLKHNYLWRLFYDEILELPEIDQDQLQSLPPTHYFDATIDYHKRRFFNCPHRRYGDLIIPPIATGPTTRLEKFNNIARIFSLPILCILFGVLSVDSMIVLVLLSRAQPYIVVTRLIAFSCFTVLLIFLEGFVLQATIAPFRRDSSAHLVLRKLGTVNLITNWLCGLLYIFQLAGLIDVVWTIVACPLIINIAMQITLLALSPRDPYLRSQIGSLLWVSLAYIPVQTTAALYFFNRDAPDVIPCFIIPIPMYIQAGLLTSFSLGKFFFVTIPQYRRGRGAAAAAATSGGVMLHPAVMTLNGAGGGGFDFGAPGGTAAMNGSSSVVIPSTTTTTDLCAKLSQYVVFSVVGMMGLTALYYICKNIVITHSILVVLWVLMSAIAMLASLVCRLDGEDPQSDLMFL
eukprot:PhF_6_TR41275/c0_g1_i2/m.62407